MTGVVALAVLKLALRAELGFEYDSNANRAELVAGVAPVDQPTGSFLLRTTARGTLAWRRGANALRALAGVGGKVFFNPDVSDQDVLVGQLGLEERLRARDWLELGASGDYYDASQLDVSPPCLVLGCQRRRDFRTGTLLARGSWLAESGEASLSGGWRGFEYKPDRALDFQAGVGHALAMARIHVGRAERQAEIDLVAAYHLERRFYSGFAELDTCAPGGLITPGCLAVALYPRADWFHEASVELTYLRELLVSVGYALQLNRSNSFGQSLLRHIVSAKLSFRLPGQLYTTLKGQLLLTRYLDPVLLDQRVASQTFISIEDENRNALVVDVERPIARLGIAVVARYSFYTNELGQTPVSFSRHVGYLGISYKLGPR